MRLLFIYGPPAVGKLTVANEVANSTGFKVFHNHLSIDAVLPVFDFGTKPFARLVELIRIETVAEAARENVDLIFTFCYAKGLDEELVAKVERAAKENGAEVLYVLLTCDPEELKRRIVLENRKDFKKANTVEMMEMFLETYDLSSPVPLVDTLTIDNTNISAEHAARQIIEHFGLQELK
jgi:deoxyadenosine/deoxycytidine kinase